MNDDDSAALLAAWRAGDPAAGDALLQRHFPSLARLFRARMPERAADLIQRTMLAAVESRARIPDGLPFRAYLLGIAHRVLVAEYRAHDREDRRRHELATFDALIATSPSELAARREQQRWLLVALRQLPLDLQLAIELHYWEDLSLEEVAAVLDVPVGTAKSRLRRARAALAESLQHAHGQLPPVSVEQLAQWAADLRWFLAR